MAGYDKYNKRKEKLPKERGRNLGKGVPSNYLRSLRSIKPNLNKEVRSNGCILWIRPVGWLADGSYFLR